MNKRTVALFSLILVSAVTAFGQERTTASAGSERSPGEASATPARAEVLVLGTYHMANRGHDIYNLQADDVLAPKRQTEIAHLIEILKRFNPTKIAVERDLLSSTNATTKEFSQLYADYLAGKHELSRDEVEQIGFRLAKELGHKTIYPVNADYDFPYQRLVNYAKATGRSKELDEISGGFGAKTKALDEYLGSHTILETLLWINADERAESEVALYYRAAHLGEVGDWAGADLLSDWFRRNIRIYSNVVQLIDSANERVLVIYGYGHLGWLRLDFVSDPTVRLRRLAEFASRVNQRQKEKDLALPRQLKC